MSSADPVVAPAPELTREDRDGVVTLTLNRPRQLNALTRSLLDELQRNLDQLATDDSARVLVIAGAGEAFSAGHDLKEMRQRPELEHYRDLFASCSRTMLGLTRLPQPVIARVHGIATAAGCQLVAACDLAVASSRARFAVSGINQGLFCSTPSVALARNLSRKQAFEMLVTGEIIDAYTARDRGLVNRVVEPEDLDAEIGTLCESICGKSAAAVRIGKAMFYRQIEQPLEAAYELAAQVMAGNMMSEDAREGIDAFIAKRPPRWKHR